MISPAAGWAAGIEAAAKVAEDVAKSIAAHIARGGGVGTDLQGAERVIAAIRSLKGRGS